MKNKNIKFQLVEVGRGPSGLVAIDIVASGAIIGDGTHRWLSIKINSFDINNDAIHIAQADHSHQLICFFSHISGISEHQPNINVPSWFDQISEKFQFLRKLCSVSGNKQDPGEQEMSLLFICPQLPPPLQLEDFSWNSFECFRFKLAFWQKKSRPGNVSFVYLSLAVAAGGCWRFLPDICFTALCQCPSSPLCLFCSFFLHKKEIFNRWQLFWSWTTSVVLV